MTARGNVDIDAAKAALPIHELIERCGVKLTQDGREYRALCPFHDESTPSFTVTPEKNSFYCFGCAASGAHVQFLQQYYSMDTGDAIRRLGEMVTGVANDNEAKPARRKPTREPAAPTWIKAMPPEDAPAPPATLGTKIDGKWHNREVVQYWAYRDTVGQLVGYTGRIHVGEKPDGTPKKEVLPVTWQTNTETGEQSWRQGAFEQPRPMYGAELIADRPRAQVILVEGEKATDAARRLMAKFGDRVVVASWAGGSKAIDKTDWSPLAGHDVLGWPDADSQVDKRTDGYKPYLEQAGMAAVLRIAEQAEPVGFAMRVVEVPPMGELPDGWDLADAEAAGWTGDDVLAYIRDRARQPADLIAAHSDTPQPEPQHDDVPPEYDEYDSANDNAPMPDAEDYGGSPAQDGAEPFRILGWNRGKAYYLPHDSRQIVELSASSHGKLNLMSLAPLAYWGDFFGSADKRSGSKIDWDMAADSLIRRAKSMRTYNPDMVRGRGAWWDNGRAVVHLGDRVVVDGKPMPLSEAPTDYVYEAAPPLPIAVESPMRTSEANKLVGICERLRWSRPISGRLMAGFVFLAPICGALNWRPHIWITGPKGTGKSTVMGIISRVLAANAYEFLGDTSEAGVRQTIGQDAMPILFDEFESERRKSADRTEDVLALVTAASSETSAVIAKGGQGHQAQSFRIRSMFAFSSIAVNIRQGAAMSRITVLEMPPAMKETTQSKDHYQETMRLVGETLTPDYIERLQARAVELIPVIRHNAEVFAQAGAVVLGKRRAGDQLGTLLAGTYALHSREKIDYDWAVRWLNESIEDWREDTIEDVQDEQACLNRIMSHIVRIKVVDGFNGNGNMSDRSVGELLTKIRHHSSDATIARDDARGALMRLGIRVEEHGDETWISFANKHPGIESILRDTSWSSGWGRMLQRITGARSHDTRSYGGPKSRGVEIPIGKIID